MNDAVTPLRPAFERRPYICHRSPGSDKVAYQLEIFPDANNALLKTNAISAQQYYFMPQRFYLAKKQVIRLRISTSA